MEFSETTSRRRNQFQTEPIDGHVLKSLVSAGITWLKTNIETVNGLNVFPVPDGDTGTNMVLTMQAALFEASQNDSSNAGEFANEFAHGALMGARGNSGVILSQIWRGFSRAVHEHEIIDTTLFSEALNEAKETAYRGVVRPVEGTILTVTKDMAEAAKNYDGGKHDFLSYLEFIVKIADESVARTPELLPVLKDAGVVDSGGKGLFYIFDGMLRYINGESLEEAELYIVPLSLMDVESVMEEIEEGQDYEVIVDFKPNSALDIQKFYSDLEKMGTSIQVGEGDGVYRMHIHVPIENRYVPIDYAMEIGTISKVYMENLIAQMEELEARANQKPKLNAVEPGQIAVITVSPGPGISKVFASLGVNEIVSGGQTMNPSTQELVAAFENMPTDRVIILPNNKNIILAANAAKEVSVKQVKVIPTRNVPQGLAAMLSFDPEGDFDKIINAMEFAVDDVETGEITTATRTVEIDGVQVNEGQIIALHNGKLVLAASDILEGCMAFLEHVDMEDYELITMFYGVDVTEDEANELAGKIEEKYPDKEVEVQNGGQPHYQYIFSIE